MDPIKANESPEIKLHFLDYWRIIRLRKSLILTVFLLVVITTCAMTFWVLPEQFASSVRIEVNKDNPDVSITEKTSYQLPWDPYFLETQFQIIQSSSILNDVIKKLKLDEVFAKMEGEDHLPMDRALEILQKHVKVKQSRNTSLIEIWVKSTDKILARDIANTIAEVYKDSRLKQWKETREPGVNAMKEKLAELETAVTNADRAVSELKQKLQIPDLESGVPYDTRTLNSETLQLLDRQLREAAFDYERENSTYASLTNMSRSQLEKALATAYPGAPNDTQLNTLAQKLSEAEEKLAAEKIVHGPDNPEYQKAQKLLDQVRKEFNDKVDGIMDGLAATVGAKKALLDKITNERTKMIAANNQSALERGPYYQAKRDLEDLRLKRDRLSQRLFTEGLDTSMPLQSIVTVRDPAQVARRPDSPNIPLNIALGIFVGLIVGVGLAFFIEYLDTSVKTIDDVERALQAPVVGVIPQNVGVLMNEGPDSPHAEAYRVLRTNLLFSRKDESYKTISVMSGGAGEGKSTTLFNLATIFVQNGSRVLVVDSDLRRPSIHKMVKMTNSVGLTNYLLKQNTLDQVIFKSKLPGLDVLPSGKLPSSSMGILSSSQMKELIQQLKQRYDFVFFDSPPLIGMSDGSILASEMDMVLQVIQYRRYPQPMTIRAKQMISKVGGNLLGIVLNNINMSSDESYYYYSGYYDYVSSKGDDSTPPPASSSRVVNLKDAAAEAKIEIKQKY